MKKSTRILLHISAAILLVILTVTCVLAYNDWERCPLRSLDADQIKSVALINPRTGSEYSLKWSERKQFTALMQDLRVTGFAMDPDSLTVQRKIGDGASVWTFQILYANGKEETITGTASIFFYNNKAYHADPYQHVYILDFWRDLCVNNSIDPDTC